MIMPSIKSGDPFISGLTDMFALVDIKKQKGSSFISSPIHHVNSSKLIMKWHESKDVFSSLENPERLEHRHISNV